MRMRVIALREVAGIDVLRAEPLHEPQLLGGSKLMARIDAVDARQVTLSLQPSFGVAAGDLYFAIDAAAPEGRFGSRVVALLRVVEVEAGAVIAEVQHSRRPLTHGDLAVFSQAHMDLTGETATILVAPFSEGAVDDAPVLRNRRGCARVPRGVRALEHRRDAFEAFLDPRRRSPPSLRRRSERVGALVFGQLNDDTLVLNTATWGTSPHPANTVGILPAASRFP